MERTTQTPETKKITAAPSGLLQRACACGQHTGGGGCSACEKRDHSGLQTSLKVSEPGDMFEREADRIASQVTTTPIANPGISKLQRAMGNTAGFESGAVSKAEQAVAGGGVPLSTEARSYFEPRFGYDFSSVRVHADTQASSAAEALRARAFTVGQNIAFASGEFNPTSTGGRQLIAHELAHVVQQGGGERLVQRTVAANSNCPPSVHGAPADPITALTDADARAQLMSLGASNVLVLEALTFREPLFGGRSYVSSAYLRRFGAPTAAANGRFRNRFVSGQTHVTQDEAMQAEMLSLSDRFRSLHTFLAGPIRYRCPGTSSYTIPGCAAGPCKATASAESCPGSRHLGICPPFWTDVNVDNRAATIIHESVHMRLHFTGHTEGNEAQRGRNPECYAAFVADVYGFVDDDSADCAPTGQ